MVIMTEDDKLYKGKVRKNFFKDENERNLWIKLNAQFIQHFQKTINRINEDLGDVNKPYSNMWVSNNQLTYDEYECDAPRFSFEQLLTLSYDDLLRIIRQKHKEWYEKTFPELDDEIPIE